jgi:hypothetical protein
MGFIHSCDSKIFGIETRNESAVLFDTSEEKHMFIADLKKSAVVRELERHFRDKAGKAYSNAQYDEAEKFKSIADEISNVKLYERDRLTAVEVSYEWLRDMFKEIESNPKLKEKINA